MIQAVVLGPFDQICCGFNKNNLGERNVATCFCYGVKLFMSGADILTNSHSRVGACRPHRLCTRSKSDQASLEKTLDNRTDATWASP